MMMIMMMIVMMMMWDDDRTNLVPKRSAFWAKMSPASETCHRLPSWFAVCITRSRAQMADGLAMEIGEWWAKQSKQKTMSLYAYREWEPHAQWTKFVLEETSPTSYLLCRFPWPAFLTLTWQSTRGHMTRKGSFSTSKVCLRRRNWTKISGRTNDEISLPTKRPSL